MSEFTNNQKAKNDKILSFCLKILKGEKPAEAVKNNQRLIDTVNFRDIITVTDNLQKLGIDMEELKTGVNKFLNLFYKTLNSNNVELPSKDTFLYFLVKDNQELDKRLKAIRPLLLQYNKDNVNKTTAAKLKEAFGELTVFENHYIIKENIIFPELEKRWDDYRCVKIMWSFHDDIRKNIKSIIRELDKKNPDPKTVNRLAGYIFFNMYAIKFREEKILFPRILETIPNEKLNAVLLESEDLDWAFVSPPATLLKRLKKGGQNIENKDVQSVDLKTGKLFPEQIRWMMNHLPVDVTYVDENNKVRYFSTPKKRIFPRTVAVIERDVRNCHPHESVHVVEKIVEAFRKGEKDHADFWINMKGEMIYIRYFAIRDEEGNYRGVLEVSQEVTEIRKLKGEQRLLDWE
jgi:DUF438 domain-containing protein